MAERRLYAVSPGGVRRLECPVPLEEGPLDACFAGRPTGAYAGLRTYGGRNFLGLEAHVVRAKRSLRALGAEEELDEELLRRGLDAVAGDWLDGEARILFLVFPTADASSDPPVRALIAIEGLRTPSSGILRDGVEVDFAPGLRRIDPEAKTSNWLEGRRGWTDSSPSIYEHLLLDPARRILEGTSSNVYFVREATLHTAGEGVLEGITRGIVLGLCPGLGIPVTLEAVSADDCDRVDEAFLSSSTRELVPITRIAGRPVGGGRPGPVFQRLLVAYRDRVAQLARRAWPVESR